MKKFLCYDTNDAASGKISVNSNGVLSPNATVPSTNGTTYQHLVTDGDGNTKWEDRLAYDDSKVVVVLPNGAKFVKVSDEIPSWASIDAPIKIWQNNGDSYTDTPESYTDLGNGSFVADIDAVFIAVDNTEFNNKAFSVVFPEKGVYFVRGDNGVCTSGIASADSATPEITWDGNIGIIKKIDEKFLPDQLILYAPEIGDGTGTIRVYKNEDASNLEYASVEEVQRAFFGRGVFIKMDGIYVRASAFSPAQSVLDDKFFFGIPG